MVNATLSYDVRKIFSGGAVRLDKQWQDSPTFRGLEAKAASADERRPGPAQHHRRIHHASKDTSQTPVRRRSN